MVKATLRSAVLLGIAAAAVLAAGMPGFAEVQNVKVGGDITVRAFHRENLDLADDSGALDKHDNFLMSTTGVNVAADLTENVSTFVRLANERDWNLDGAATGDFDLSQAYITLKELFYSPLTLRVGTQPIVWGRGFVLGSNLIPSVLTGGGDRNGSITANEFTDFTAFDAIRATLDLSSFTGSMPLTADYVYIKLNDNTTGVSNDVNLQGINLGTKLDAAHTELEAYYLNKLDDSQATRPAGSAGQNGSVNTLGVRGSSMPVDGLSTWGELAYQWGTRATDSAAGDLTSATTGDRIQAWATDWGLEYTLKDVSMTPKVGAEWIFWSGHDADGAIAGWDPIARGYFTTAIREFQTAIAGGFYGTAQAGDTSAATNQSQISFWGGLKPVQDLSATSRLNFFWQSVGAIPTRAGIRTSGERKGYAGAEWDNQLVYDYTDDVQLGFLWGIFFPGSIYHTGAENTAQELVTTVSVKF